MACSRHAPPAVRRSPAPSKARVFTLYWRPLQKILLFLLATTLVIPGCRRSPQPPPLFEAVTPEASGITFANTLSQDSVLNIVNYLYYYNGGGHGAERPRARWAGAPYGVSETRRRGGGRRLIVVARNNDRLQLIRFTP